MERRTLRRFSVMASSPKRTRPESSFQDQTEKLIRVRLRALEMPPIKDGLVIGRNAAIGGEAMTRTLRLVSNEKFERISLKDPIVEEIIVRQAVLRKIGRDRLVAFVLKRVKPLMAETELLLLDIDVELVLEDVV
jgi:hypothetical protein